MKPMEEAFKKIIPKFPFVVEPRDCRFAEKMRPEMLFIVVEKIPYAMEVG
jgi:hypothetical protein